MDDLKKGDVISADSGTRYEIVERVGAIVFTREIKRNGVVGPLLNPDLIEDLATYGFRKEQ